MGLLFALLLIGVPAVLAVADQMMNNKPVAHSQ
jgi:hypothetical protein